MKNLFILCLVFGSFNVFANNTVDQSDRRCISKLDLKGQAESVLVDKTCSTISVLPPDFGVLKVHSDIIKTSSLSEKCNVLADNYKELQNNRKRLDEAYASGIRDDIQYYKMLHNELLEQLAQQSAQEGLSAKFTLSLDNAEWDSKIATLQLVNPRVKVQRAKSDRYTLSYSKGSRQFAVTIPGNVISEDSSQRINDGINFDSSSGEISVNLGSVCSLKNSSESEIHTTLTAMVVANLSIGYEFEGTPSLQNKTITFR